jgi:hypothetical protein
LLIVFSSWRIFPPRVLELNDFDPEIFRLWAWQTQGLLPLRPADGWLPSATAYKNALLPFRELSIEYVEAIYASRLVRDGVLRRAVTTFIVRKIPEKTNESDFINCKAPGRRVRAPARRESDV